MRPPGFSWRTSGGGTWLAAAVMMMASNGACSLAGGGGDDDGVERRVFLPAVIAVADAHLDVAVTKPRKPFPGKPPQRFDDLDGERLGGKLTEDRRLIAGPGADLQHLRPGCQTQQVRHQRDDVRLRDRLAVADGQGAVEIGQAAKDLGHELVAGDLRHNIHHRRVERPSSDFPLGQDC